MKKKKSTKAKARNLVRVLVILFLSMLVTIFCCKREDAANEKILEATVNDAFVFQSMMLVHSLDPNKANDYTDIESLEDDSDSFVSDAAIKTGKSQYYIRVNYGANCVNIYSKDDEGNYTVPYKAMICSTGKSTPKSGTYKITYKYRWLRLFGDVYGQYSTRIVKNILFHSVPYFKQRADTLEYEEYDKLGTTASAGCIRLTVQDAKWIYDNITSGTYVEFYSDKDNPGPLGKPKAQKISDNEECRDWDPTDPDKNNPWNGGSGIPSVTYTYTYNKNKNNSTTNNMTNKTTNTIKNDTNTSNKTNTNTSTNMTTNMTTNTTTNKDKNQDNEHENKIVKNEIVKNEISTNTITNSNTSNTNVSSNNTTKPTTNTTTKPNSQTNTNTTIDNSDKETTTTKPIETPSKEPEKNNSSTTNTTKPSEDTTIQTPKPESSSQESTETSITNNV